jgi:hypothetical protein
MNRNLNPQQFYHGTPAELNEGDEIHQEGHSRTSYMSIKGFNYFTPSYYSAAAAARGARGQNIYTVEPTGQYGHDPGSSGSFRSKNPLRVTGKAEPAPDTQGMRKLAKIYRTPTVTHNDLYMPRDKDPDYEKDANYLERRIYE